MNKLQLDRAGWFAGGSGGAGSGGAGSYGAWPPTHQQQQQHHQQQSQQPHQPHHHSSGFQHRPLSQPYHTSNPHMSEYSSAHMNSGFMSARDPAPAPAPAPTRGASVGPSHYGYPSTSGRRALLTNSRQHRSMDTVGPMDSIDLSMGGGFLDSSALSAQEPLAVSTQFPGQHNLYGNGGLRSTGAPLSNPIPSNSAYWSGIAKPSAMPYGDVGGSGMDGLGLGMSSRLGGEYDQLKADYQAAMEKLNQTMNSIKTFWSPELKRERQLRREESNRIAQLENMLQTGGGGGMGSGAAQAENVQLRMELGSRDDRIRQLTSLLDDPSRNRGSNSYSELRVRELEDTIMQLQDLLKTKEQHQLGQIDASGRFALENALRRVDEKESRIAELEDELCRLRIHRSGQPRDFTDKSVSNHDMVTVRMKLERSELELSERKAELAACQIRMRTAEEQASDMRAHLQALKEQITSREQQCALHQGDVEALRQKLEAKNEQMGQRESRIERLEKELNSVRGESHDKTDQMRQSDLHTSQLVGRVEALETSLREKEQELDKAKVRLLSHPDVIKEKELREKIEQGEREKRSLQDHVDQLRRNSEKDRMEQQDTYQTELRQLRSTIDNLQKELLDRDVLLESQNEKIGDLGRELAAAQQRMQNAMVDKGTDELRKEVENARNEVEKLLKMVRQLEKENTQLSSQCKQLQGTIDSRGSSDGTGTLTKSERGSLSHLPSTGTTGASSAMKKRIEELEDALRESVSITAEREVHLSQQKHLLQQVNSQLADSRRELGELRKAGANMPDREQMMRSVEMERRQHLEQLFQLKQEALLAAIGEKDAHLALLEKARAPREEVDTIRRHKEGLMRKLKQENERRVMVLRPESAASMVGGVSAGVGAGPSIGPGGPIPPHHSLLSQPSPRAGDIMTNSAELDDAEGIWA